VFENLHLHAKQLHGDMVGVFWVILPCLLSILITLEIIKNEDSGPNVKEILKRTVLCVIMLWSFDFVISAIAMVSDEISHLIKGNDDVWKALKQMGPNSYQRDGSMFDIREHIIYFFAIAAYLIAYIGFFASTALVHFVWAILYITAPLLLPCFISPKTAQITGNLYRGLINVAAWKIMWTLLGSLLLKMALSPNIVGIEDYFLSMVINLLIGISMLVIPFFTKSLISDGLQSAASGLAVAPGLLAAKSAAMAAKKYTKKGISKGVDGLNFASKPLTNPLTSRAKILGNKMKLKERFNRAKRSYGQVGISSELKEENKRQQRKKYAIRDNYNKKRGKQSSKRRTRKRKR
jgi:hypothetical protein